MGKTKEKWYISKRSGYCMALPEGLVYQETVAGVTTAKHNVTFRARGGKMVKTSQPEIQEFLEKSIAFKRALISRVRSPEEIALDKKKAEQEANLKVYHNLVESNKRIDFGFEDMGDSELRKLAETIGAATSADGKKLAKASVALNVTGLIYGSEVKPEDQATPEKTDVPSNQN